MKHIHFIVNPIAGAGNNKINIKFLQRYFDKDKYVLVVKTSAYKKHAVKLTQESIIENANIIVACGGDGTVNEVASCIIGTQIILAIIPFGSGNGLASNLKISKNIHKAIALIKAYEVKQIDVGCLNNHYFFSNTGFGFDAQVVKNYEASESRKLLSYIKATLKSFKEINYNNDVEVIINEEVFVTKPFMVFISNSNELGYKVSLTPKASLQDGLLDVLVVSKINTFKIILFGLLIIFKKHHLLKEVKSFQTKKMSLSQTKNCIFQMQIDGELHIIKDKTVTISISEKTLNIIT